MHEKKKRQTDPFRDAHRVKPKIRELVIVALQQPSQSESTKQKREQYREKERQGFQVKLTPGKLPYNFFQYVGNFLKEYKQEQQVHIRQIPEDSSHTLQGKLFEKAMSCKENPSTKSDQIKQPRQDNHKDCEMILETPKGYIVPGQKAYIAVTGYLHPAPPKGIRKKLI